MSERFIFPTQVDVGHACREDHIESACPKAHMRLMAAMGALSSESCL